MPEKSKTAELLNKANHVDTTKNPPPKDTNNSVQDTNAVEENAEHGVNAGSIDNSQEEDLPHEQEAINHLNEETEKENALKKAQPQENPWHLPDGKGETYFMFMVIKRARERLAEKAAENRNLLEKSKNSNPNNAANNKPDIDEANTDQAQDEIPSPPENKDADKEAPAVASVAGKKKTSTPPLEEILEDDDTLFGNLFDETVKSDKNLVATSAETIESDKNLVATSTETVEDNETLFGDLFDETVKSDKNLVATSTETAVDEVANTTTAASPESINQANSTPAPKDQTNSSNRSLPEVNTGELDDLKSVLEAKPGEEQDKKWEVFLNERDLPLQDFPTYTENLAERLEQADTKNANLPTLRPGPNSRALEDEKKSDSVALRNFVDQKRKNEANVQQIEETHKTHKSPEMPTQVVAPTQTEREVDAPKLN